VIVDVRLAEVFLLLVFVRLVIVGDLGMVVLVTVGRDQVRDVLPVTAVVGHMAMIVVVNRGLVGMHVRHRAALLSSMRTRRTRLPSLR
jgi:hypothetical protein